MALGDNQKSFYDSRRQFQGNDNPDVPAAPPVVKGGMDRTQILTGLVFLAVLGLGFYFFGRPEPLYTAPTPAAPTTTTPTPAPAAH